jgi:hypothetical protein
VNKNLIANKFFTHHYGCILVAKNIKINYFVFNIFELNLTYSKYINNIQYLNF